ncbi:hypothetical protein [Methanopyrus sp. KOL6]|uniref:hypothetical protein n=1 Tax=Methanopyrus sp. KOL6 TaxID=1937004 RepID=UPI0012FB1F5A|nr:hypothetical protein [Methanopyrus sp. KOL6]
MLKELWRSFVMALGAAWALGLLALTVHILGLAWTIILFLGIMVLLGIGASGRVSPFIAVARGLGLLSLLIINAARLEYLAPWLAIPVLGALYVLDRPAFYLVIAAAGAILLLRAIIEIHKTAVGVDFRYRSKVQEMALAIREISSGIMEALERLSMISAEKKEELSGTFTVAGKKLLRWMLS